LHTGKTAKHFDEFFEETGGLLRAQDLAAYRVRWQDTLSVRFNEKEVHVPPPESTGFSVLLGLRLLEAVDIQDTDRGGMDYVRKILSVLERMDKVVDGLSKGFSPYDEQVPAEVKGLLGADSVRQAAMGLIHRADATSRPRRKGHTTSLSVVDGYGNMVCLTQTLDDGYGSGVVVPGTGILLNNGMAWVETDPAKDRADVAAPGKHFFVPVIPTICLNSSGLPCLALGTPGGKGIPQTTAQVLSNLLFFGDEVQAAIARPRLVTGSMAPRLDSDIKVENGFQKEVYEGLGIKPREYDWAFGHFQAVQVSEDGSVTAITDSRRPGVAFCQ
jgi:gamma-glutamyltranspeptidase/glutathione hydrolase